MEFKLGELFSGPGGLGLGARRADIGRSGWKIVHQWANDFDADACDTYLLNICGIDRDRENDPEPLAAAGEPNWEWLLIKADRIEDEKEKARRKKQLEQEREELRQNKREDMFWKSVPYDGPREVKPKVWNPETGRLESEGLVSVYTFDEEGNAVRQIYRSVSAGPGRKKYAAAVRDRKKDGRLSFRKTDFRMHGRKTFSGRLTAVQQNRRPVILGDVRKLDMNALPEIDALAFGFPCNDYSMVGEQKGLEGHYGPLYSYGIKALRRFRPLWFMAENVSGLKSANEGAAFRQIMEEMQEAGYRLYPNQYSFEEYGVPQARHRIIIIGIRDDLPFDFKIPDPAEYKDADVSCRNAIENPPIPENAFNNELTRQKRTVVERLNHIRPGQNAFNAALPEHLQLNVKGAKISQIYRRLDPDKPAYTVTGSGGGGTHMYHWSEPRALTNRERARLQTFPDDFRFSGSKESVRRQIGMAVPCKGAEIIFEAVLKTFAGIPYSSVAGNLRVEDFTLKRKRKPRKKKNPEPADEVLSLELLTVKQ